MDHNRKQKPAIILIFLILGIVGCVGISGFYFLINSAVVDAFGKASPQLTAIQRFVFPFELYFYRDALTNPMDPNAIEEKFFVDPGESVSMVCIRLEQRAMIPDAEVFRTYLVYTGFDTQLQAGQFELSPSMSPLKIAEELLDSTPKDALVVILPGWRIEEIAESVAGSGLAIEAGAFAAAAYAPDRDYFSLLPIEDAPTLEGFLFPGSYLIPREAGLKDTLTSILTRFSANVDQEIADGFKRQGLTFYEGLILASIVQKEAVVEEEKPLIASVFFNRLEQNMRLETDPTVQYALGFQEALKTWWKSPLSVEDLSVDSPYNTYIVHGLPPTPISNPNLSSIRAVAFPAETPYFYFRAKCDGSGQHNFAVTYEEHINNACE